MEWRAVRFDWNQLRAFLVTAEEGSLSAAARALGLTQPTLGRQVAALEATLGVTLFERVGRSLELTESGAELLDHARKMGDAAIGVSLAASGQSQQIEGTVSITGTHMMATCFLPPILQRIREEAPGIQIDVVCGNDLRDLQRREADIAIRHVRPEQPDLISKLVREGTAHLYAAKGYFEALGSPRKPEDFADAMFINFERSDRLGKMLQAMGLPISQRNFVLNVDNSVAGWELIKRGLGIGGAPTELAAMTPDVQVVLPDIAFPVPTWLTTHRELHTSRRIRLVYDILAEELAAPFVASAA